MEKQLRFNLNEHLIEPLPPYVKDSDEIAYEKRLKKLSTLPSPDMSFTSKIRKPKIVEQKISSLSLEEIK